MSLLVKSPYPKIQSLCQNSEKSYKILKVREKKCFVIEWSPETLGRIPIQPLHCVYMCVSKKDASPLQRAPQVQNGRRSGPHRISRNTPDLAQCIIDSVNALRPKLKEGIPELDVPSIEPLPLERVEMRRMEDKASRSTQTLQT
ncbi:hypothetical protein NQ317_011158 [Molorchus minor]|uniref:Uncharacterized protein n=1 Tax=Molorchus minor TaxID=1323400 RepID=A0ABQ9JGL3_9CUCU|nr:hypothetical protein NQ317_011158 [Molorchus minor]